MGLTCVLFPVFLSLYCSSAWLSACKFYQWTGFSKTKRFRSQFCEWVPGLAVLLERPNRRKELASYCLSHALNTIWNNARLKYNLKSNDWVSVLSLAISIGVLLQHFEQQPNLIASHVFGIQEYPIVFQNKTHK